MKKLYRALMKTVKVAFAVFCFFLVLLAVRDQRVPTSVLDWICRRVSSASAVVNCQSATVGFRRGIRLSGLRVFNPHSRRPLEPVLSGDVLEIRPLSRRIVAEGVRYPRLPDSYYDHDDDGADAREPPPAMELTLPRLPTLAVELLRPSILGVDAERVSLRVRSSSGRMEFDDIALSWPDSERRTGLGGSCVIDAKDMRLEGRVDGTARQANIRPLMVALDLPIACTYIDAFTGVTEPVPAGCGWKVDLASRAFSVLVELHPELGRYNGVPMKNVDGRISVNVTFPKGGKRYVTTVGPLTANDRRGGVLDGQVSFDNGTGRDRIRFDATSTLAKNDILDIVDCLNDGLLDCLKCATPPRVSVNGFLFPDPADVDRNDLHGTLEFAAGSLFGAELRQAHCEWSYVGDTVTFTNAAAQGLQGGMISGRAAFRVPVRGRENALFDLALRVDDGHLGEFTSGLGIDFGERRGELSGEIELRGTCAEKVAPGLNGRGSLRVRNGRLAQMKLFLGLTEMLAEYVPGVAAIVNQSQASADFKFRDGVVSTENLLIEGSLVSIKASGSYDMVADRLNFIVQVRILKDENLLGKFLLRPILWPFTKLLLEYRLTGGIEKPEWKYISILDRVL